MKFPLLLVAAAMPLTDKKARPDYCTHIWVTTVKRETGLAWQVWGTDGSIMGRFESLITGNAIPEGKWYGIPVEMACHLIKAAKADKNTADALWHCEWANGSMVYGHVVVQPIEAVAKEEEGVLHYPEVKRVVPDWQPDFECEIKESFQVPVACGYMKRAAEAFGIVDMPMHVEVNYRTSCDKPLEIMGVSRVGFGHDDDRKDITGKIVISPLRLGSHLQESPIVREVTE